MSIGAMKAGAHVACEVPIALTLKDCWEVVRVSEETKRHCMMLENCCYDFFEMLTLNMTRQGLFGELLHGEGAYIHDLRFLDFELALAQLVFFEDAPVGIDDDDAARAVDDQGFLVADQ